MRNHSPNEKHEVKSEKQTMEGLAVPPLPNFRGHRESDSARWSLESAMCSAIRHHPQNTSKSQDSAQQPLDIRRASDCIMKPLAPLVLLTALGLIGCGAGHANLTSISVSPQSATAPSNQGQVGYTATGNFANGKSRELSQVDGLSWKTAPTSAGTVAATIGSTGEATCSAPGTITVTASAPQNLQFTINNGIQNTSATVSGTATLICQ